MSTGMRNLVFTTYLSLDGVFEEPAEWSFQFWSDEAMQFKQDELFASDAMLLGRKTFDVFAAVWPSRTDEQGFAEWSGLPDVTHLRFRVVK
jgi:dihydrofolate reductase